VDVGDHPQPRRFHARPQCHEFSTIAAKVVPGAQAGPREASEEPRRGDHPLSHPRTGLHQPQGPAGRAAYLRTAGGGQETIELGPRGLRLRDPGFGDRRLQLRGDDRVPELIQDNRDGSWRPWDKIVTNGGDFGRGRAGGG
jgi:hypothetical protein